MSLEPRTPAPAERPEPDGPQAPAPRRLYVFEPGWNVGLKVGSERVFCYMMAPGQDYYHRLLDGEIYVYHGPERICLACAERRGLLAFEPRGLREPLLSIEFEVGPAAPSPLDLRARNRGGED